MTTKNGFAGNRDQNCQYVNRALECTRPHLAMVSYNVADSIYIVCIVNTDAQQCTIVEVFKNVKNVCTNCLLRVECYRLN